MGRTATVPARPSDRSDARERPACSPRLRRPNTVFTIAKNDMSCAPWLNVSAACDLKT